MGNATPAQLFAGFFGFVLLLGGVVGLTVVDGGDVFKEGGNINGDDLLIFETAGWLNLFWIATGALGILATFTPSAARSYALGIGVLFLVVAVWGIIDDNTVAEVFPINREDNVLHLGIGLFGLFAGLTSGPGKHYRKVAR